MVPAARAATPGAEPAQLSTALAAPPEPQVKEPPTLVRSSLLNFADLAVTLLAAAAVSIVLARSLGPERFGVYALVGSVVSFTVTFARLGISDTLNRYIAELAGRQDRTAAALLAFQGLGAGLVAAAVAAAGMALLSGPLSSFFHVSSQQYLFVIGAVTLIPQLGIAVVRAVLRGLQRWRYFVQLNLAVSPLWVIACYLTLAQGWGVAGILLVGLGADIIQMLVLIYWVRRELGVPRLTQRVPVSLLGRVFRYNVVIAALLLLNIVVWKRSELLFLGHYSGVSQVSYYSLPFALTEQISGLLPGALLGVMLPGLTYAMGAADPERFGRFLNGSLSYLAILTIPIFLFAIPTAGGVIAFLYGSKYGHAVPVLQVLSVAMPFAVLAQATGAALLGIERQSWLLKVGAGAAALSLLLDFALIPKYGAMGAAIAKTIAQAGWAAAAFVPIASRIKRQTVVTAAKAAATAIPLALALEAVALLGASPILVVIAGVVASVAYIAAVDHMRLVSARSVMARLTGKP
jgi:O-antigen/teichoic acid export membrane protein